MIERKYDLYWIDTNGKPTQKVGGDNWKPMSHTEAITARSKFSKPTDIMLVEI